MLVWRIENETGYGPYRLPDLDWQESCHCEYCGRPSPEVDYGELGSFWRGFKLDDKEKYKFGFVNPDSLRQWFTEYELFNLSDLGFRVAVYDAGKIWTSDKQCAFVPADDCPEKEIEIPDFLKGVYSGT